MDAGEVMEPTAQEIRDALQWAHDKYHVEGELEVETAEMLPDNVSLDSQISAIPDWKDNGGFYVKAWLWVPYE